jgi:hypothetical protein
MMNCPVIMALAFTAACAELPPSAAPALHDDAPNAMEAARVLEDLNDWCAHPNDDCDVAMRPDAHPGHVAAGETNGWISSHRERLLQLGFATSWTDGHFVMSPRQRDAGRAARKGPTSGRIIDEEQRTGNPGVTARCQMLLHTFRTSVTLDCPELASDVPDVPMP